MVRFESHRESFFLQWKMTRDFFRLKLRYKDVQYFIKSPTQDLMEDFLFAHSHDDEFFWNLILDGIKFMKLWKSLVVELTVDFIQLTFDFIRYFDSTCSKYFEQICSKKTNIWISRPKMHHKFCRQPKLRIRIFNLKFKFKNLKIHINFVNFPKKFPRKAI